MLYDHFLSAFLCITFLLSLPILDHGPNGRTCRWSSLWWCSGSCSTPLRLEYAGQCEQATLLLPILFGLLTHWERGQNSWRATKNWGALHLSWTRPSAGPELRALYTLFITKTHAAQQQQKEHWRIKSRRGRWSQLRLSTRIIVGDFTTNQPHKTPLPSGRTKQDIDYCAPSPSLVRMDTQVMATVPHTKALKIPGVHLWAITHYLLPKA